MNSSIEIGISDQNAATCKNALSCSTTECPFAYTDLSEEIQNYGCLPTPQEIVNMASHKKIWACHTVPTKPCLGAARQLKTLGINAKGYELLTELSEWDRYAKKAT